MFGAEWMCTIFGADGQSEHYQSDADLRRWVGNARGGRRFYQQALWHKNELDRPLRHGAAGEDSRR
ncbi:hypothetical protein LNP74_32040 [Klebsiella pneumoniae subsp. pneumoniae]|nr:hypothetical protein [Klebsiella pneumoniae subsp. pneumoniae]